MPEHVPPDRVRFELHDGAPVVTLDGVTVTTEDGWSILVRPTLVVVDGPGDDGFLLRRATAQGDAAPAAWDAAVDRAGGATVSTSGARFFARVLD